MHDNGWWPDSCKPFDSPISQIGNIHNNMEWLDSSQLCYCPTSQLGNIHGNQVLALFMAVEFHTDNKTATRLS